jgi:hypothetical protein
MTRLPNLTHGQWQAASETARLLMTGDVNSATDRAAYRNARARLVDLLPQGEDANAIVQAAVRWRMKDDFERAEHLKPVSLLSPAMIPHITSRETGSANNVPVAYS